MSVYREMPAKRERFFFSSDGETFFDLDEVVSVLCGTDDDNSRYANIWLRTYPETSREDEESNWTLWDDEAREFMSALHAYRRGDE